MKNILLLTFFIVNLMANQFGLKKGMTIQEIDKKAVNLKNGYYKINPPKPYDFFEQYIVRVSPKQGLCYIKGISKDIYTNGYGISLKSKFYELEELIDKKYGKHKRTDYLALDSIWDRPRDFMMGLLKEERFFYSQWNKETGLKNIDNLKEILSGIWALSSDKGYITIEYYYDNYDKCQEELKRIKEKTNSL